MLEGERKSLDDGINKLASKTNTTTVLYILAAVIIAAIVWKFL